MPPSLARARVSHIGLATGLRVRREAELRAGASFARRSGYGSKISRKSIPTEGKNELGSPCRGSDRESGTCMALGGEQLTELIYGSLPGRRFTQDSPVMPDVWLAYAQSAEPVGLLLTPHTGATPGALAAELHDRLAEERRAAARVAQSDTYVVADL